MTLDTLFSSLLGLAGMIVGTLLSWSLYFKKYKLEIDNLRLENEKAQMEITGFRVENERAKLEVEKLRIELGVLRKRERDLLKDDDYYKKTQQEEERYLSNLLDELNVWRGLGLGRVIELEEVYVWVYLKNDGERRGKITKDTDLLDLLLQNRTKVQNPLIIGGPGTGKSTLLRRWAYAMGKDALDKRYGNFIPLFLSLGFLGQLYISGKGEDWSWRIEELAVRQLNGIHLTPHVGLLSVLEEAVRSGKATIFLDALDEVPEEARDFVSQWINNLSRNAQDCLLVVTSRPCSYSDQMKNFERYNMVEFNEEQIKEFTDHWFAEQERETAAQKVKAVSDSERVLKSNPLFLTMLCIIIERGSEGDIPSPGILFERFVRELLEHLPKSKRYKLSVDTSVKLPVLQAVALELFERDIRAIVRERLLEQVDEVVKKRAIALSSDAVVGEIVETSGMLVVDRSGYYSFWHPLFQEFFVAREINESATKGVIDASQWIADYSWKDKYKNVLAFFLELREGGGFQ